MLVPAAAAQGFDQSLDGLVRQRVITSQERKLLRGGGAAVPIERSRFEKACRTGLSTGSLMGMNPRCSCCVGGLWN